MPQKRTATTLPSKRQVLIEPWRVVQNAKQTREKIAGMQALLRHMPEDKSSDNKNTVRDELRKALRENGDTKQ